MSSNPDKVNMKNDIIIGLIIFLFTMVIYFYIIPNYSSNRIVAGMQPQLVLKIPTLLLGGLGLLLSIINVYKLKKEVNEPVKSNLFDRKDLNVLLTVGLLFLFIILFKNTHFIVASIITIPVLMFTFGYRKYIVIISITLIISIGFFYFFEKVLGIYLS